MALPGLGDAAVVAVELAPAALVVGVHVVERHVDGVGRAVVVGLQVGLLVRTVSVNFLKS